MTGALFAGALAGLGCFLLVVALAPRRPGVAVQVARLDASRLGGRPDGTATRPPTGTAAGTGDATGSTSAPTSALTSAPTSGSAAPSAGSTLARARRALGARLENEAAARGWRLPRPRADLAVLDRELGDLLAAKVLFGLAALVWLPLLWLALLLFGIPVPPAAPAVVTLLAAAFAFFLPDLALRAEADRRRRDFRHVVGCFLDLVAMNLAGGRGLPEALLAASSVGEHPAMIRISTTLTDARLAGRTPWVALGELGDLIGLDELRDLAGALTLAADDGAKVRASLSARAASIRRKELADAEGQAGERSQSMLVAQLLICAAFMVFLAYPATYQILRS